MSTFSVHPQSDHLDQWNGWIVRPRPRRVRLKQGYRFWYTLLAAACVIVPGMVIGFLFVEWRASPSKQVMNSDLFEALPFVVVPLVFLLIGYWISIGHKRLLTRGEISIGKVTAVH